jgi:transposase
MLYVGLDVHSKLLVMCVLDEQGKVVQRACVRQVDQLIGALRRLPRFAVCFEASCDYGWLHDALRELTPQVVVAHPGRLRLIFRSKRKNDRLDAERLAKLLFLGEVPSVHVPPAQVRDWREMINFRRNLIAKRTRAKNGLRALLRSLRIATPRRPGLWTKGGLVWVKQVAFAQPMSALRRDLLVHEIEDLSEQLRRVEQALGQFSKSNPAIEQLRSIPGVGLRTAEAMVAFLDDPGRFERAKQVGAYFGLVPSQDQSASANRLGHITRDGSPAVRQFLVEAAWQAIRRSPTVKAYFERIHRNDADRRKIALVATAHYLARIMWAMLRDGSLWNEALVAATSANAQQEASPRPLTVRPAANLAWDPEAGSQARRVVPAAPPPGQTRRSRRPRPHTNNPVS